MERLLEEERERERRLASESGGRRRNASGSGTNTNYLIQQLVEMGFPAHWCSEALAATGTSSVDEALTWILTNGERLSAQDANDEDDDGEQSNEHIFISGIIIHKHNPLIFSFIPFLSCLLGFSPLSLFAVCR